MAARFEVRIEGGDLHDGIPFFEPFQEVAGTVSVQVDLPVECRALAVRLMWHTEGRGDEDAATIQEIDIYQGRISTDTQVDGSFRFQLPGEPWSFAGKYVSIIWAIEVNIDVRMGRDLSHRERFVMRPKAAR